MNKNFDWLAPARWDHKNMNFVEAMLGDYFDEDKWAEMWNEIEEAKKAFEEKNNRIALMTEASEIILGVLEKNIRVKPNRRDQLLIIIGIELGMQHQKINGLKIAAMEAATREKAHLTCLMVVRDANYDDGLTQDDFRRIVMENYARQGKCLGCPHKDDKCAEMQSFEECLPYVVNYIYST